VTAFKLLGIRASSDLKWTTQVDAIVANAASRLHFLKQLKQAGAPIRDLLHFYTLNHKKRDILFLTITLANLNRFV